MPFYFCPHCGTKLQPDFRFCPTCGEKLPCPDGKSGSVSPLTSRGDTSVAVTSDVLMTTPCHVRNTRSSLRLDRDVTPPKVSSISPVKGGSIGANIGLLRTPPKRDAAVKPTLEALPSPTGKSPRLVRGKAKLSSPAAKQTDKGKEPADKRSRNADESAVEGSAVAISSPLSSPVLRSPLKGKAKKAKQMPAVDPLQDCKEVTDMTGKNWKLGRLLSQSETDLIYEVFPTGSRSNSKDSYNILKLGPKDGRIFNEQTFLQRAAKHASVEKWIKQKNLDFMGIPSCVGFGLHADSYRFLIFSNMGDPLQSVMEEDKPLSEKTVLLLAYRIIDVLQYIHSNEYAHGDINAENIYIKQGEQSQVFLAGYYHAFRFCPAGQHVLYREASRTPHEGAIEFISLDTHKGASPSRRSDLQSLGYCMLCWHTGKLPWSGIANPDQIATQKQSYMDKVPALLSHCFGKKKVSRAFQTYLTAVMALQYSEQPDYSALQAGLSAALLQLGGSLEQPITF